MSTLNTFSYADLQTLDAVTGKVMFADSADKDAFYRLRVSQPKTLYEGYTIHDANPIYFDSDLTSGAAISGPGNDASMLLTVNAGATLDAYAARQSHFYVHVQPGKSLVAYFSFCFGLSTAGIVKRIGLYDVDNTNANVPLVGVLLEQSTDGLAWWVYKGDGTTQNVSQSAWNVDPLDGSGASGVNINPETNLLGFVDLDSMGVGRVRVGFFVNGVPLICHAFTHTTFTQPYVRTLDLPIRGEIRRTVAELTASSTMRFICCTMMSEGGVQPVGVARTLRSLSVSINNNAIESLIAIRLMPFYSRAQIIPLAVELASDIGGNATAYFRTYLWRPSSGAIVAELFSPVSSGLIPGGSGSMCEYTTSSALYSIMEGDVSGNNAVCILLDESSITSIAKSNLQFVSRSLVLAQSSVDRSNTDILLVAVNNTTPNSRAFTAMLSWREI